MWLRIVIDTGSRSRWSWTAEESRKLFMLRRKGWGEGWAIRDDLERGRAQVVRIEHPRLVVELAKTEEGSWDIHSIELLDDVSVDFAGTFVEESFEVFFRWLLNRENRDENED